MGTFSHILTYLLCFFVAWPAHAKVSTSARENKGRKLEWIDPNTVRLDVNTVPGGNGSDSDGTEDLLKRLRKQGQGKNSNSGAGAGAGSGIGSGAGGPAGLGNGNSSNKDTSDRGGEPPGGAGKTGDADKPQVFEKFWPMCVLLDQSVPDSTANEIVKGLHDKAAACRVNLYVEAVTVAPVSGEPGDFNPKSQSTCNMGAIGFPTASVLLANPDQLAAAKMCGAKDSKGNWDPGVAGCAQLRSGGMTKEQMQQAQSTMSFQAAGSDGIIPSVIVPSGWDSGVAMHEAIGHSQMGWPNHEPPKTDDAGLGIGKPKASWVFLESVKRILFALMGKHSQQESENAAAGPEGSGLSGSFNGVGCAQMYARAFPNTKKVSWVPSQAAYFKHSKTPWPFGKPLWGPQGPPSGDGGIPPIVNNERPKPPKEELFMDDGVPKNGSPVTGTIDGRHKKKPGSSTDSILSSLRKGGGLRKSGDESSGKPLDLPPEKGGKGSTESLTFDDTVKKGDTSGGDRSSTSGKGGAISSSSTPSASTSMSDSGGGESLTFDDSVAKGDVGSTGASSRNPASVGSGASAPIAGAIGDGLSDSLDDGFFNALVKAEAVRSKRTKGSSLRGNRSPSVETKRVPTATKSKGKSRDKGAALRR